MAQGSFRVRVGNNNIYGCNNKYVLATRNTSNSTQFYLKVCGNEKAFLLRTRALHTLKVLEQRGMHIKYEHTTSYEQKFIGKAKL